MISPSSLFGILLNWISLTATVSPVAQLSAPFATAERDLDVEESTHTVDLTKCPLAQRVSQLLQLDNENDDKNIGVERT